MSCGINYGADDDDSDQSTDNKEYGKVNYTKAHACGEYPKSGYTQSRGGWVKNYTINVVLTSPFEKKFLDLKNKSKIFLPEKFLMNNSVIAIVIYGRRRVFRPPAVAQLGRASDLRL